MAGALVAMMIMASPAAASKSHGPTSTSVAALPRAWILVDADRGVVLDAGNDRQPMPPASLTKLLTALIATTQLTPTDTLTVSDRAAGEPASKINMKTGQVWNVQDSLHALLLSSANDAAIALAERTAGSLEGFAVAMQQAAGQLGLQDNPILRDPAGLDDNFSVDGGNLLSARDLAIIARAALAQPLVAEVVATPVYSFVGPDGAHHRLGNHNQLLKTYPGAIGMKTGYTAKSGEDLIGAARRGGRTMIAVVMGAPNIYRNASALLDEGFASPATSAGTGDVLPARSLPQPPVLAPSAPPPGPSPQPSVSVTPHHDTGPNRILLVLGLIMLAGTILTSMRRRQVSRRRTTRRSR